MGLNMRKMLGTLLGGVLSLALITSQALGYTSAGTITNTGAVGAVGNVTTAVSTNFSSSGSHILLVQIFAWNGTATAPSVSSVTDTGSAGLSFTHRVTSSRNNTWCSSPCSAEVEVWWAPLSGNITSENIKVTWGSTVTNGNVSYVEVNNVLSTVSPFDSNVSLPATANGSTGVASFSGTVASTNNPSFVYTLVGIGQNSTDNSASVCGISTSFLAIDNANIAGGRVSSGYFADVGNTFSLSSPTLGDSSTCPTGTSYTFGTVSIMDAIKSSGAQSSAVTWNPTDLSGVALSNHLLTASSTAGSTGVRATIGVPIHSTCKLYYELTDNSFNHNLIDSVITLSASLTNATPGWQAYISHEPSGTHLYVNSSVVASVPSGTYYGFAIDFQNQLVWVYSQGDNEWNASGTANPSTGVGGLSFAALGTGTYYPGVGNMGSTGISGNVVGNFGASSFNQTLPTGFSSYNSGNSGCALISTLQVLPLLGVGN